MTLKLSLKKRILFSIVTTCGFFMLLEAVLALAGVDPITETTDPFVGFSTHLPLFEETNIDGIATMETAENKLTWFNYQRFPKTKPADTIRVFCLGGSTTYGRPFHDPLSFAGWLRNLMPIFAPNRKVEILNAGGVSYASYRVAAIMEELAPYQPDLFIIYAAHNEFLERRTYGQMFRRSRVDLRLRAAIQQTRCWAAISNRIGGRLARYRLRTRQQTDQHPKTSDNEGIFVMPAEVDEMLNHTVGPADYDRNHDWQQQVVRHFEFNLRRMVALSERMGAAVIFVTPASNLRDCSPFKSQHSSDFDPSRGKTFDDLLYDAHALIEQGKPQEALSQLAIAEDLDQRFALLHYEKGRALFELKRYPEARIAFQRAIDEDICPLRAVSPLVKSLRKVAAETDSQLVDYERDVRERCLRDYGHDCLGREHFLDHVHPTIDEYRQLALVVLPKLAAMGIVDRSETFTDQAIERITQQTLARIDTNEQGVAFRNLAKVFHWAGKFSEALTMAERALALVNHDVPSLFIAGECERLLERRQKAITYFERVILIDPFHADAHIALGMVFADDDRLEDAAIHLSMGVGAGPDTWYAQQEYGIVLFRLGEYENALLHLGKANRLQPGNQRTEQYLKQASEAHNAAEPATAP